MSSKRKMPYRFPALLAFLFCTVAVHAQSQVTPRYEIYTGYSLLSNSLNGIPGAHHPLSGWDVSAAFPDWHGFRFKLDTSGYIGSNLGASQNMTFILGGAEYSHRVRNESVFLEALGGDGGATKFWGPNGEQGNIAAFSTLLGGGVDTPINRRISFRAQADFQYAYFALVSNLPVPQPLPAVPRFFGRFSTGIVWRFPARGQPSR